MGSMKIYQPNNQAILDIIASEMKSVQYLHNYNGGNYSTVALTSVKNEAIHDYHEFKITLNITIEKIK